MANSISGKLLSLAETYYISYGSPEQIKIDASVGRIKTKLKTYFGSDIFISPLVLSENTKEKQTYCYAE